VLYAIQFDAQGLPVAQLAYRLDSYEGFELPADQCECTEEQYGRYQDYRLQGGQLALAAASELKAIALAEAAGSERAWRDSELNASQWPIARHRDEKDAGLDTTLSADQFAELLAYRQALRDWPAAKAFPDSASRPVAPTWLAAALAA